MNDLNRMYQDIVKSAQVVEAPYSEPVIQRMLDTFGGFSRGAVQFRTTTKPHAHRRLDVRYEEINAPEIPLDIARRAGFLVDQGRDIDRLLPQIYDRFPYLGDGVDFDVQDGFTKLWFFPKGVLPVEEAFQLPAMPKSVAEHAWYYDKYRLHSLYIIGIDYLSRSMNLYLQFNHPSHHTPEALRGMVQDLGFETPSDEAINSSLQGVSAALTFTWDSPHVERICFYSAYPNRAAVPTSLHPVVSRFVEDVPAVRDSLYQVSWTFGTKGTYVKVENDYTGDMMEKFVSALLGGG